VPLALDHCTTKPVEPLSAAHSSLRWKSTGVGTQSLSGRGRKRVGTTTKLMEPLSAAHGSPSWNSTGFGTQSVSERGRERVRATAGAANWSVAATALFLGVSAHSEARSLKK
jgi:hypothetical protein